jgi:hypothetical protein
MNLTTLTSLSKCDTKFRGVSGNFARNTEETKVQKHMEFHVNGIQWTHYFIFAVHSMIVSDKSFY